MKIHDCEQGTKKLTAMEVFLKQFPESSYMKYRKELDKTDSKVTHGLLNFIFGTDAELRRKISKL